LGHDADIGFVAAVVTEAIEAQTSSKMAKQGNIVLEPNVGSSSATATAAMQWKN
jgi:Ca2+/H+ antiporter